jgi:hypothetical protein
MRTSSSLIAAIIAPLLASCNTGGNPFSNPFGAAQPRLVAPAQQPPSAQQPSTASGRPSIFINAPPKRVEETIIARAQRRGTNIVGASPTGVTLEIPLKASSIAIEEQCGVHKDGRTLRVFLETLPSGIGTTVSEDKFVIDGGASSCQFLPKQADVDESIKSLADLKQQSEAPRTASTSAAQRPADPSGRLEPLNPGRPVVPVR